MAVIMPVRRQAIIWTNAGLLAIGLLGKLQWNFNKKENNSSKYNEL